MEYQHRTSSVTLLVSFYGCGAHKSMRLHKIERSSATALRIYRSSLMVGFENGVRLPDRALMEGLIFILTLGIIILSHMNKRHM